MGRRHAKQTKATVGDLQKVSSNESTAKREINWKWMLSQQNGPRQRPAAATISLLQTKQTPPNKYANGVICIWKNPLLLLIALC